MTSRFQFTGAHTLVLLALVLAAAGCDDGTASAPIDETVVAGALGGPLADDVLTAVGEDGDAGPPAVLIGNAAEDVGENEDAMRLARRGIDARLPVVLVGGDARRIAELRRIAGLPDDPTLASDPPDVLAYGVDLDADGDAYEIVVTRVASSGIVQVAGMGDDGRTPYDATRPSDPFDDADAEPALAQAVVDWLHDDGERSDDAVPDDVASALADAGGGETLQNEIDKVANSTERRMVFSFRKNVHTLATTVWSAHSRRTGEDWFYVRQRGTLSAISEIYTDSIQERGRYTYLYGLNTSVHGWQNDTNVFLDQSSPSTVQNTAELTNRTTWKLDGEVGVDLKAKGPEGSVSTSVGVSVDHTYKIKIPDVVVRNLSGTTVNNARWEFDIARPYYRHGFFCIGAVGIEDMSAMSKSTFQPMMDWVWRVSPAVRAAHPAGLPIQVDFLTGVGTTGGGGPFCLFREDLESSQWATQTATVPWPPR